MLAYALAAVTALAPMTGLVETGSLAGGPTSGTADGLASSTLYRVLMVRAAPGELLGLIELYKTGFDLLDAQGEARPFWMRHTQGDHWDLMLTYPMENVFLRGVGRPGNLIFVREAGAEWDCFTLGFYRDLQHYAESSDVPADVEDRAAREAGFEGAGHIGNFMRSLIQYHNDTLLVFIR